MSSTKPPQVAIGMVDEVWTVAIADQFGWVKAGTGDPLDDSTVARWTHLHAVCKSGTSPHADGCTGCDGPGVVPCGADRVLGDWAYRDGKKIKNLLAGETS